MLELINLSSCCSEHSSSTALATARRGTSIARGLITFHFVVDLRGSVRVPARCVDGCRCGMVTEINPQHIYKRGKLKKISRNPYKRVHLTKICIKSNDTTRLARRRTREHRPELIVFIRDLCVYGEILAKKNRIICFRMRPTRSIANRMCCASAQINYEHRYRHTHKSTGHPVVAVFFLVTTITVNRYAARTNTPLSQHMLARA